MMRLAFVLELGSETNPDQGQFEGRIEEVNTGLERARHARAEVRDNRDDHG